MLPSSNQHSPTCSEKLLIRRREPEILFSLSFQKLATYTFVPSLGALLMVFMVGFGFDYLQLLNYEWTCGNVLLPSLSRIINLPTERVVWHLGMMLHAGMRPIFMAQNYLLHSQSAATSPASIQRLSKLLAFVGLISGFAELAFTLGLTVVGERESGTIHVYFFIAFIISCCINQLSSILSCRLSHSYNAHRQVRFCLRVRIGLSIALAILVPSIFIFFVLYWRYCVQFAYDFFASLEYITVFVVYGYHIASVADLRKFECHVIKCKK